MASKAFLTSWRYITCSPKPTPGLKATSNDEPGAQRGLYLGRLCLQVVEVTSTSLGMAMHTAWPACPLNTLEWNIPHYSYQVLGPSQVLCIEVENGDSLPSHLHPSLTRPSSLLLHTVHTQKNEDQERNGCFRPLFISKEFPFSLLTCTHSMFRNGIHKWYWRFQRLRCLKDAHNFLEGAKNIGVSHLKLHPTQITPHQCAWSVLLTQTGTVHTLSKSTVPVC